ncbi:MULTISPECIES: amino acid ABC transporter permease [unclassified Mesorhizobium]|uniref:amino acid ABC transporter permease n=1 Tax=unclassified Mesorhizobium TaxID=325217 RepID=UPI00112EDE9B|nr:MULTISPECIES: amino acid ABC transporter permease [unclassified Mesorhizobium]TPJ94716.1 amino acid ABC transporter permease [Mesorhizobium sp. B2-5-10]TPK04911.1 amino acid ABC transporter permease [Mesorhizobium sp. B2-5-11]TPK25675.1 amino acid ABC transporter permease [Mesorhizobium sp. B2-5-8]
MEYLDFSGTFARGDLFVHAAMLTVGLSAAALVLGMCVGIVGALMRLSSSKVLSSIAAAYVEIIRNTPFLVQIYIVYFGLPSIGIRISEVTAAILSLTLYAGAYITEIVCAGIQTIGKGQREAAHTLGMSPYLTFRYVVLLPAISAIFPALTSQFILIMLASSVVSVISVPELTGVANDVQGLTFRSLEAYLVVAAIYLVLTAAFKGVFALIDRALFSFRFAGR